MSNKRRRQAHLDCLVSVIYSNVCDEKMIVEEDENGGRYGNEKMSTTKSGGGPRAGAPSNYAPFTVSLLYSS